MTERVLPQPVTHLTEFWDGYNGTCQETALAVSTAAARGFVATEQYMVDITHQMAAMGILSSPNGSSTLSAGYKWLTSKKYVVYQWRNYNYYIAQSDWVKALQVNAGIRPIVLMVANGQALVDNVTGARDESGLHYHYIAIVGMLDSKRFICADGDNPEVTRRFQVYTLQTLINAHPCGYIIIDMQRPKAPPVQVRPMLQLSQATKYFTEESNGNWKSIHTGKVLGGAILAAYRSWPAEGTLYGLTAWGLPVSDEIVKQKSPEVIIQHFERCTVAYDPKHALDWPAGASGDVYITHSNVQ